MAVVNVVVCDVCSKLDRKTKTYQVNVPEEGVSVDVELCDQDAVELRTLVKAGTPAPRKAAATPRNRRRTFDDSLTTVDAIERSKRRK